jgi:ferredoxin
VRDPSAGGSSRRPTVSILYYSAVGGTRIIADLLGKLVGPGVGCEVLSIEDPRAAELAAGAGLLVLCYPTYFLKPAPLMLDFLRSIPASLAGRQAVLVTSYELYTGDSNRRAALLLRDRDIPVVGSYALRSPGTDVTCVVPDWLSGWLYRFERGFPRKVAAIAGNIAALAMSPPTKGKIPSPKWYAPLAWIMQTLVFDGFIRWRDHMTVLGERCTSCGLCVRECPRGAWQMSAENGLKHFGERCDLCTRCVHRCPQRALVLVKGLKDNRRLDAALYAVLLRETLDACRGSERIAERQHEA